VKKDLEVSFDLRLGQPTIRLCAIIKLRKHPAVASYVAIDVRTGGFTYKDPFQIVDEDEARKLYDQWVGGQMNPIRIAAELAEVTAHNNPFYTDIDKWRCRNWVEVSRIKDTRVRDVALDMLSSDRWLSSSDAVNMAQDVLYTPNPN
jgi:hypothetical protein